MLIVLFGAIVVFGGYYVWTGFLAFLEDEGDITAQVTREAFSTATAEARPAFPTVYIPASFTPLPPCQWFRVRVDRAVYRECPSTDDRECPRIDSLPINSEVCVYDRVPNNLEWYVIELNPGGAYRDTAYMHESVIEPANPTLTPSITFTPLPTVSPVPSQTSLPVSPAAETPVLPPSVTPAAPSNLTPSPNLAGPAQPTPTLTPSETLPDVII
ncbi:MAG: hypothetical protein JW966_09265 [Anaerolineae bacterium]|nr:hypothetical protein [Anaerolineae bacterium]